jgi:hypothetical protein
VAGAVLWAAANELLIQPKEYTCYNLALERIRWGFRSMPAEHSWQSWVSAAFRLDTAGRADEDPPDRAGLLHGDAASVPEKQQRGLHAAGRTRG